VGDKMAFPVASQGKFFPGMTLHQWYAGQVLKGLCANPSIVSNSLMTDISNGVKGGIHLIDCSKALASKMIGAYKDREDK